MNSAVRRPGTVIGAVSLLLLTVSALLADAVGLCVGMSGYTAQAARELESVGMDDRYLAGIGSIAGMTAGAMVFLTVVLAVALLIVAVRVGRGRSGARLATWIVGGITVLGLTCGLNSDAAGLSGIAWISQRDYDDSGFVFMQDLPEGYPGWYQVMSLVLACVSLGAIVFASGLLAMPSARDFFLAANGFPVDRVSADVGLTMAQAVKLDAAATRRQRGELTAEEYAAERARILSSS